MSYSLYQPITYTHAHYLFARFSEQPWAILLDSANSNATQHSTTQYLNRYSFIVSDPFLTLVSKNGEIKLNGEVVNGNDPIAVLQTQLANFSLQAHPDLPPFQGGAVGYFGYELVHHLEKLPRHTNDDMQFADLAIGFYDVVIAFDHMLERAWVFSSGYPEQDEKAREARARIRCDEMVSKIEQTTTMLKPRDDAPTFNDDPLTITNRAPTPDGTPTFTIEKPNITSPFTAETYQAMVTKVIDYIHAGDIFQANVSQRFCCDLPSNLSPYQLYLRLRHINPAAFAAYLNLGDTIIASASPERFLKLNNGTVETHPIKGTRPRYSDPVQDNLVQQELLASEKDHAENIMIVDVLRNDLARVCQPHGIKVEKLCELVSYPTLHHLVSSIYGKLEPDCHAIDLFRAAFPGGSITGAPKVRAMEIIAELEPTARGPYCGAIGYIGFDGCFDTSIVIRTYAIKNNKITFQVGGGIVADSDPAAEYEETFTKAKALINALIEP